jgi:protoporphyrinogen IX oxidase
MLFYSILKTLHFVGLISWMAGIFYLPRLLVYYREALDRDEPERTILARNLSDYAHRTGLSCVLRFLSPLRLVLG